MNEFKIENINFEPGIRLIEASAGTGKTHSIGRMFIKAILAGKNIKNIAAITYTEAATAELKRRLREFLTEELEKDSRNDTLKHALNDFDLLTISTIHSFCRKMLGTFPVETDIPVKPEFIEDGTDLKDESAMDFWRHEVTGSVKESVFEKRKTTGTGRNTKILNIPEVNYQDISKIINEKVFTPGRKITPELSNIKQLSDENINDTEIKRHLIEHSVKKFEKYKETLGQLTFDDLTDKLNKAVNGEYGKDISTQLTEQAKGMYEIVFVDEFQDSDPLMAQIFKSLFGNNGKTALFYIGDPKQSIFGFRNADIFSYLKVEQGIKENMKLSLNDNYRSTPEIIDGLKDLFSINKDPFNIEGRIKFIDVKPTEKVTEKLVDNDKKALNIWGVPAKKSAETIIHKNIVSEIKRLLKDAKIGDKALKPSDIAILVTSNKESGTLKEMLLEAGVPAIISSSASVFNSDAAKDLMLFLNAVIDNRNLSLIKGALFTMFFSKSTAECAALDSDSTLADEWLLKFESWHEFLNEKGFLKMFSTASKGEEFENKIAGLIDAERNITNLRHISELIVEYEKKNSATPSQILDFLIERSSKDAESADEYEQRLDSERDRVIISTIHKSKGLQYNIVFIPSLYKGPRDIKGAVCNYHDENDDPVVSLFKTEDEKETVRTEELQEKLRLCYVALTRAVHRAYFVVVNLTRGYNISVPRHLFNCGFSEIKGKVNGHKNISYKDIENPSDDGKKYEEEKREKVETKSSLEFKRDIGVPFKISSYSALAKKKTVSDEVDMEVITDDAAADVENEVEGSGIFAFKKGAFAGIALHKLFEIVDFSKEDLSDDVKAVLEKHNLLKKSETEEWTEDVVKMVKNVLSAKLKGEFSLSEIRGEQRFNEMEFLFPVKSIKPAKVAEILAPLKISVDFDSMEGFLNGFIDLVFEKDKTYYIVDWKSNHLGNSYKDYSNNHLDKAMKKANYDLQYIIYTAAIHLHLSKTIENYDYDSHFGGIFYIFLRGVDEKGENGIYYKKPEKKIVEQLADYFQEVKNEQ